jgi:hypothetical protein
MRQQPLLDKMYFTQAILSEPKKLKTIDLQEPSVSVYENEIPLFAEHELERLYGSRYSSLAHFRAYGGAQNASTYVIRKGSEIIAMLLFQRTKRTVHICNEGIKVDKDTLSYFVNFVFNTYPTVHVITLHAVEADFPTRFYPYQSRTCVETVVLDLPSSVEEYQANLGKATRSYINRYLNKIKRDFPSFKFDIYTKKDIQVQHIWDIVNWNRARMTEKLRVSWNTDEEARRILRLVKERGYVGVMSINGKICAGTINCQTGENYSLGIISHDSAFNDYRIGTLCCYLTICECIAQGGGEYNFGWGKYDYKYRLLGKTRQLNHVAIYRSRTHAVLHMRTYLRNLIERVRFQLKLKMRNAYDNGEIFAKAVFTALYQSRKVKLACNHVLKRMARNA